MPQREVESGLSSLKGAPSLVRLNKIENYLIF